MINSVSKYSFGTGAYAPAAQTPEKTQQSYAPIQQPQQDTYVRRKKQDNRSFWDKALAPTIVISSVLMAVVSIRNGKKTLKAQKELEEKTQRQVQEAFDSIRKGIKGDDPASALDQKLDYQSVFTNYKDNQDIPTLDGLPGMEAVKKSFRERIINPKTKPEVYQNWGAGKANGVLLYGPAGTGKTFATKVLAKSLGAEGAEVAEISIQKEGSAYVNQAAKNIGNKFDFICKTAEANPNKEFVIIMEEIDGIGKARGGLNESSGHLEVVNTLLTCFDKSKKYKNITIVANTNNDHLLDSALKDRLPVRIKIDNPDKETIKSVLDYHLKNITAAKDFDTKNIIDHLEGYSNRKIEQIVNLALSKGASAQMKDKSKVKLTQELFEDAIKEFEETKTTDVF
jgi:SpoVK/Ycf46/Vps4 family AAA+-type ATPase